MRVQYIVISIILAVIVLVIAISAVAGTPGIVNVITDFFNEVPV